MQLLCETKTESWPIRVEMINIEDNSYELIIAGRGSQFHTIIGHYENGLFVCIPNHGVGCELATFTDTFWNNEKLSRYFCPVDAATLNCVIRQLPQI